MFCLRIGKLSSARAMPIIGPPHEELVNIRFVSAAIVDHVRDPVPMGRRIFFGSLMAEPSTVIERETNGLPDFKYRDTNAALPTFITMQPTSAGSFPGGTRRPGCRLHHHFLRALGIERF